MANDEDAIYIDVIPRLDAGAADREVGKLRQKMEHAGDGLKDVLSGAFDSIGDKLGGPGGFGEKFHDVLSDALSGREWNTFGHEAGSALGKGVSDALKDLGKGDFGHVFDHFGDASNTISDHLDKILGRVNEKIEGLSKAGTAVGNVLSGDGGLQDVGDIFDSAKGLGINLPGPVNDAQHAFNLISWLNDHPGQIEDKASKIPGMGVLENVFENWPRQAGQSISEFFTGGSKPSPASDSASDKWSSDVAGAIDISSQVANISAGTVSLGGSISLPGLSTGNSLAGSSGGGGRTSSAGIGVGGSGDSSFSSLFSGGGGTTLGKGHYDTGGVLPGDAPGHDNMIGVLPSGSMVGLEGGEGVLNNRAMSQPGVSGLVALLNQHYDDGGTVGGDTNNVTLSNPPTQNHTGNAPITQQQLGSGQGAGISGGGLIGAAEQAGVAAAGVAGFGGGAIAAQIAEQETNLAIQKSSQIAATLAAAPFETFGLGGGQMGAPQVNPMNGWIGKLIGGALGQQTNLPNIAGTAVQPPKQPTQKDPTQQGQGESVSNPGPTGSKDDPHYVKSADPPTGPPIGSATSAMSTMPAMTMAP